MDSALDWHTARALLDWQVELGVTEAIAEAPVDRFEAAATRAAEAAAAPAQQAPGTAPGQAAPGAAAVPVAAPDPVAEAERAAAGAADLAALRAAIDAYEHCDLRRGARSLVFSDGAPGARVMVVGETPGREEDRAGKPFVGAAGTLLDRMFEAIGLGRDREGDDGLYVTTVLPWRSQENRDPRPDEIAMFLPFLRRHVELAAPRVVVIMGNVAAQALLNRRGISRLRGQWTEAAGRPALPMLHPTYLLRHPVSKRDAWADLLALKAHLQGTEKDTQ